MFDTRVSCYKIDMEIKLTAVFRKFPEGYAAFVEELPGANTQGATLEEARANLKEAVEMCCRRTANWRKSRCAAPRLCVSHWPSRPAEAA